MKNYLKLLRFLKGHRKIFTLATVFMGISTLFEGFQLSLLVPLTDRILTDHKIVVPNQLPDVLERLVDQLNATPREQLMNLLILCFLIMFLLKNVVTFLYGYFMNDVSQRIMRDIRYKLYEKIQDLSLDYFSKKRSGELISRITHDVSVVDNAVSYGVTDLFRQSFTIIMFICIVFSIYFKAAILIFLIFPLIGYPMRQLGRKLRKLSKSSQEKMADINALLVETISGIRVVKAFSTERYELKRFLQRNHEYYKLKMKSIKRLLVISPMTEMVGALCGIIIIMWLGRQVMAGELSFGIFVLFFGSMMSLISPIKKLGNVNALTQQALAANDRIYEVLDTPITVMEKPSAQVLPYFQKSIAFERVSFEYDKESGLVLRDIEISIPKGEILAVVGPTGSGKTTLVNLIPRFYDPIQGRVLVDGWDLKDVSLFSLRQQVGMVTQETVLFNDSIYSNIAYGRMAADKKEIEDAARRAYAHHFIVDLPHGYETVIGDRGVRLSGGERQRLAIARAILKDAPILILDEATSQLDSESEKFVQEAIDALMKDRTVICIAHRFSTIKQAHRILVVESGRMVGLGPHETLIKTCPLYQRLYETQFQA